MRFSQLTYLGWWWVRAKFFGRKAPLQSVVFISDRCNLSCKHCTVYNHRNPITKTYAQIREELQYCYSLGSRFVDFDPVAECGVKERVRESVLKELLEQ